MLRTLTLCSPPPQDLPEPGRQIIAAISEVNRYMLQWVWAEMCYCLDIRHVTKGLTRCAKKKNNKELGEFFFLSVGRMLKSFPPFQCTDFMKCVRELQINNKQFETPGS